MNPMLKGKLTYFFANRKNLSAVLFKIPTHKIYARHRDANDRISYKYIIISYWFNNIINCQAN